MSRSKYRHNYVGDAPVLIDGVHDSVTLERVNPNEHWEGRKYPEWQLVKMGEADNTPGDPFDADWSQQLEGEN